MLDKDAVQRREIQIQARPVTNERRVGVNAYDVAADVRRVGHDLRRAW